MILERNSLFHSEQLLLAAESVGLAALRAIFAAAGSLSHGTKRQNAQQAQHLNNFTHSCHLFKNTKGKVGYSTPGAL